jgi:hypothetical protein
MIDSQIDGIFIDRSIITMLYSSLVEIKSELKA